MPASCSACRTFGHSDKICAEVQLGKEQVTEVKGVEWRAKGVIGALTSQEAEIATAAIDSVVNESCSSKEGGCSAIEDQVLVEKQTFVDSAHDSTHVGGIVSQELILGAVDRESVVVGEDIDVAEEEFPPLQSPEVVRGKGRGRGRGASMALRNKFAALQGADSEEEVRKPRVVSLGVRTLLHEMKTKKAEKVKSKVPEAVVAGGVLDLPQ
ncbi:hypothetical protein V6N11_074021 [Hibiscus sabdariffa]|uniref:Uncharacterized protein n=2 Tax=Hibiscus sabdariffa TaxID=183260 RepID=A0ABR2BK71_9ROSI